MSHLTPDDTAPRLQPQDLEAEKQLLGAVLLDGSALNRIRETIQPGDFYADKNCLIYRGMLTLADEGTVIDLITLGDKLKESRTLDAAGGMSYLAELIRETPSAANVRSHAKIVRKHAETRRFIAAGEYQIARAYEGAAPLPMAESPQGSALPVLTRLSDVQAEMVSWLWPGRIPRGKLTLIVGDPGVGKSLLTVDLAARISRGTAFPDDAPAPCGDVIILTAEDGKADTIRPRLDAAGGDASHVYVLDGIGTPGSVPRPLDFASDLEHLECTITKHAAPLLIVDPITAYLGDGDSYKDADVRRVLGPLAAVAERTGVAILGIMHLSKNEQRKALYRALNSIAFVAAARAVFAVAEDPEAEGRVLFLPLKMNLAEKPCGLAYRKEGGRIIWDSAPVTVDAETALGATSAPGERSERLEAKRILVDILRDGPMRAEDVREESERAGISPRTLERAKAALGIRSERVGGAGATGWWQWSLPPANIAKMPKAAMPSPGELVASLAVGGDLSGNTKEVVIDFT